MSVLMSPHASQPGFVRQPAGRDASCVLLLSFMSARLVSRRTFLL
ncbi:hypothetical protein BDA96_02G179900 [Sorghum bicolor]|uniref:Uncharacterized protein n=1 Tax=Sorghum bicolor TaxID=4558 RepID=A0A921RPL2_SORBI|nr:hypothetical protein BDA96_02G179900 [Sorghum bicolor]